jgi:hypothetical protein
LPARRFSPPRSVDDPDMKLGRECFIVRDASPAYVYFEDEPGRPLGGAPAHPRRGAADRSQHRQAAGAAAAALSLARHAARPASENPPRQATFDRDQCPGLCGAASVIA